MGGFDSHAQQNSYYSTAKQYHARTRNWLPLLYLLVDVAITNSYILYKEGVPSKKLSHVEFQEEIARGLLRGPGAILRERPLRQSAMAVDSHTKSGQKDTVEGHSWGKLSNYRHCQVCTLKLSSGKPRNALSELSTNVPRRPPQRRQNVRRTIHICRLCELPICYNSHCWE
jgi:hypothetical protein